MFQAILFGKFDEAELERTAPELLEDILTSDVFGAFRYLPARYLERWCVSVLSREPGLRVLAERIDGQPEIAFWPRFSSPRQGESYREPDVVVLWPRLWIVVEAKLGSNLTLDQLQAEYDAVTRESRDQGGPPVVVVACAPERPKWWNSTAARSVGKPWLAFSSWQWTATVLAARDAGVASHERLLLDDVLARLRRRGITPFTGLHVVARAACGMKRTWPPWTRLDSASGRYPGRMRVEAPLRRGVAVWAPLRRPAAWGWGRPPTQPLPFMPVLNEPSDRSLGHQTGANAAGTETRRFDAMWRVGITVPRVDLGSIWCPVHADNRHGTFDSANLGCLSPPLPLERVWHPLSGQGRPHPMQQLGMPPLALRTIKE